MSDPVTLVIPAFNEAGRLDADAYLRFLESTPDVTILFVDDGSTDPTRSRIDAIQASARSGQVEVMALRHNVGKAEAVRRGLVHALESGAALVGFADADLSAPLAEIMRLRDELERFPASPAAIGSRVKLLGRAIHRSELRHYLGRVFATCASIVLGLPVYDTQCGMKLFRNVAAVRAALAKPFVSRWIFDVELIGRIAAAAGGDTGSIREVPLEYWKERGGSRVGAGDFLRAPLELWRIRRNRT